MSKGLLVCTIAQYLLLSKNFA